MVRSAAVLAVGRDSLEEGRGWRHGDHRSLSLLVQVGKVGVLNPLGSSNLDSLPHTIDSFVIPSQKSWPFSAEDGVTWLDKNSASI